MQAAFLCTLVLPLCFLNHGAFWLFRLLTRFRVLAHLLVLTVRNVISVCFCKGCHNKTQQSGQLQQQTFASYGSGGWGVQHQGAGLIGFILRLLLLVYRWSPFLCVHVASFYVHTQREVSVVCSS